MREILFKAKRLDNGEWVGGDVGFNNKGDARIWLRSDIFTSGIPVNTETVCQYTGLRDKNGAMIFEGDILRFYDEIDIEDQYVVCIEWAPMSARWAMREVCNNGVLRDMESIHTIRERIIIGNIHDK